MLHELDNIQNMLETSSPDLPCETFHQYFQTLNTAKNRKIFKNLFLDNYDTSNQRGIFVTSNLGKHFNRVTNSRLLDLIEESSLISENQIDFKEKGRTSGHLFTIKTLSEHRSETNIN